MRVLVAEQGTGCVRRPATSTTQLKHARLALPPPNVTGALAVSCCSLCMRMYVEPCCHTRCCRSPSPQSQSSCLYRLRHNRSAAAALKLWLGMSGLVVLFILVAENPSGRIHPTVSYAVMTVPTHGVIALVLAWHERVESTFIRVGVSGWLVGSYSTLRLVGRLGKEATSSQHLGRCQMVKQHHT